VVFFVVLGSIFWVGYVAGYSILVGTVVNNVANSINTRSIAIDELNSSYSTLNTNLTQWQHTLSACNKKLTCVTRADGKAATYFSTFANELQATPMPPGASAAASGLYSDATTAARDFTKLSRARTVARYRSTITSTHLQQAMNNFNADYNTLGTTLTNS